MNVGEAVSRLEASKEYNIFVKKNPDYYLVHAFTMIVHDQEEWQLGYYNEESDMIVVFEVSDSITQVPAQQALKQNDTIKKLDLGKVKMEVDGALKVTDKEKGKEKITKKIVILQNLDGTQVYNITLVTSTFHIVNFKISAETGQVLKHTKQSIMNLGEQVK